MVMSFAADSDGIHTTEGSTSIQTCKHLAIVCFLGKTTRKKFFTELQSFSCKNTNFSHAIFYSHPAVTIALDRKLHAICIVACVQINKIVIMKRCMNMKCSSEFPAKQHCSMHADQPKSHQTTYDYRYGVSLPFNTELVMRSERGIETL